MIPVENTLFVRLSTGMLSDKRRNAVRQAPDFPKAVMSQPEHLLEYWNAIGENQLIILDRSVNAPEIFSNFDSTELTTSLTVRYKDDDNLGVENLDGFWDLYEVDDNGDPLPEPLFPNITTGTSVDVVVGEEYKILAREYTTAADKKYLNWDSNNSHYAIFSDYTCIDTSPDEKNAHYKSFQTVDITANGDVDFEIYDPWYIDSNGNQPDMFLPASEVAENGQMEIFQGRGGSEFPNLDPPFYKIKIKEMDATTSGIYQIDEDWDAPGTMADHFATNNLLIAEANIQQDFHETIDLYFVENPNPDPTFINVEYHEMNSIPSAIMKVRLGDELTLPEGAVINFSEWTGIEVSGEFNAISLGTEIILKPAISTIDWSGIALKLNSSLNFENVTMNQAGISFNESPEYFHVKNCTFNSDQYEEAIYGDVWSNPWSGNVDLAIENCIFKGDFLLNWLLGNIIVTGCQFTASRIIMDRMKGDLVISNNQFTGRYGIGEVVDIAAESFLDGTLNITDNLCALQSGSGVGIAAGIPLYGEEFWDQIGDTEVNIINNTIIKDFEPEYYTNGIFVSSFTPISTVQTDVNIYNNIIVGGHHEDSWGVILADINYLDNEAVVSYDYNNFYQIIHGNYYNGGSSYDIITPGSDDMFENPLFISLQDREFELTWESPCINAGNPNMQDDQDGSPPDLGYAYYPLIKGDCTNDNQVDVAKF